LTGKRVTEVLDRAAAVHGLPKAICVDNGPEFSGRELDAWASPFPPGGYPARGETVLLAAG
jgi:hypothetical protein